MNKWLIKSTARSGSHLIYNILESSGLRAEHISNYLYKKEENPPVWPLLANRDNLRLNPEDNNIVVHDHTTWIPPDTENWNLIYTTRLDKISQTISAAFAETIGEYLLEGLGKAVYTDTEIEPFTLSPELLLTKHRKRIQYEKKLETSIKNKKWKTYNLIYFEDLIQASPSIISHMFRIDCDVNKCKWQEQKNPRSVSFYVVNYDEIYNLLSQNCN